MHHGIDIEAFAVHPSPGEHLLFFGRIHPDKCTAEAIAVARSANRPLLIAGIIQDERYFADEVAPHIDGESVRFLGPVDASQRTEVLGGAHAFLHLIDFDEPFGYSVVESMASGTPVIAYDRGSMTELIEHGTSGYLVNDRDHAAQAVELAASLDRASIRASTRERFSAATMVNQHVALYRAVLAERNPPLSGN